MRNFAYLKRESPFFELFPPSGQVPIVNIIWPSQVSLEGSRETLAFMVDVPKLSADQKRGIAERLSICPEVVLSYLAAGGGLPLRCSQVRHITTDSLAFL